MLITFVHHDYFRMSQKEEDPADGNKHNCFRWETLTHEELETISTKRRGWYFKCWEQSVQRYTFFHCDLWNKYR